MAPRRKAGGHYFACIFPLGATSRGLDPEGVLTLKYLIPLYSNESAEIFLHWKGNPLAAKAANRGQIFGIRIGG